jgi:hypothetical protein
MEKRKRFDDELLDLENPGADDSFLNEYLQDEESKKKLKKSSPVKTIKISFKKFSQPNNTQTASPTSAPVSTTSLPSPAAIPSPSALKSPTLPSISAPVGTAAPPQKMQSKEANNVISKDVGEINKIKKDQEKSQQPAGQALDIEIKTEKKVVNDKKLDYTPKETKLLGIIIY